MLHVRTTPSHRLTALSVVIVVALVGSLGLGRSSTAQSAPVRGDGSALSLPAVGVNYHPMWDYSNDAERQVAVDKLAGAGVGWVRIDFAWCSFQEAGRGLTSAWYVERADAAVNMALASGLKVLAMVDCTPGWANGHADDPWDVAAPIPPTRNSDFADFATWAAAHFKGRISAWEVWNEPDLPWFWSGTPGEYADLLAAAYPAFKAADPDALVVSGGVSSSGIGAGGFLEKAYAAGMHGQFDVLAEHPYMSPSDLPPETDNGMIWTIAAVSRVHDLMVRYGDGNKPIWFTEFGWSSHATSPGAPNWLRGVSEAQQADFVVRAIEFVAARYPYVANMLWYNERNGTGGEEHESNFGLLRHDLSSKPAYLALQTLLLGCTISGTDGDDVLRGTPGDDVICAGDGDDTVYAGRGTDVVYGGRGEDDLRAGRGNDAVYGGPGNDHVYGRLGNDRLFGNRGDDFLGGNDGADRLIATDGVIKNDVSVGGAGTDVCQSDSGDTESACP
jgi:polysaccharide biosynthesis protein PslG